MDCLFGNLFPTRAANVIVELLKKREGERKDVLRS